MKSTLAAIPLALLTGCTCTPIGGEPRQIHDSATAGAVRHASGFEFPQSVDDFMRVELRNYDEDGMDMGAGYNNDALQVAATVFVYPRQAQTAESHFRELMASITSEWPDVVLEDRQAFVLRQGDRAMSGFMQSFRATQSGLPKKSDSYLFELESFFVKYRFTYPTANQAASQAAIATFMERLSWPSAHQESELR